MVKLIIFFKSAFPFLFRKRVKPKEVGPPLTGLADVYHKIEDLLKKLELVKYNLEDTDDWKRLSDEDRKLSQDNVAMYWKRSHFQTSALRDEVMLTLQRIPNVRFTRKVTNDNQAPQETKN